MEISLDYEKAERQVQCLEQSANDMLRQSREIGNIIADIRKAWQGDTAGEYIRKLHVLEAELRGNANKCSKDAIDFRAKIDAIKKADEETKRIIEATD